MLIAISPLSVFIANVNLGVLRWLYHSFSVWLWANPQLENKSSQIFLPFPGVTGYEKLDEVGCYSNYHHISTEIQLEIIV